MKKNILLVFLFTILSILLYYSPLNVININNLTADNIDKLNKIPFDSRTFIMNTVEWMNNDYDKSIQELLQTYGKFNKNYKIKQDNYDDEYEVFFGQNSSYDNIEYSFSMYLSSIQKSVRLIGYHKENNLLPSVIILRPYVHKWKEKSNMNYNYFFNKYVDKIFNSFKSKGYTLKKTKLKNGHDILINNNINSNYFLVIKKIKELNGNNNVALEFYIYRSKKITLPIIN